MAGALVLLPPVLTIVAAVLTRRVHASLLLGLLAAGALLSWPGAGPGAPFATATGAVVETVGHVVDTVGEPGNAAILLFLFLLGGLVALLHRSGAMRAFGEAALRVASTRRRIQVLAWALGTTVLAVDDHFNVVAAGTLLRPVTDRLRVSREKLAYLVDSTASPVAILNPVGTWAGFMGAFIAGALAQADGYGLFLRSIPLNMYAWATLALVLGVALSGRDLGPMRRAEARTTGGQVAWPGARPLAQDDGTTEDPPDRDLHAPRGGTPRASALDLLLPLVVLAASAVLLLWATGRTPGDGPAAALTQADAPIALASATALTVLFVLTRFRLRGLLPGDRFLQALLDGGKSLVPALTVLVLALALGAAVQELGLGAFVAGAIGEDLPLVWLPLAAFAASALIALSTGTSFGTYAVAFPITLGLAASHPDGAAWYPAVIAATAGGGAFGDHCSPISDTTVLSSMAARCDHMDHVRTQAPYAALAALLAAAGWTGLALGAPAVLAVPVVVLAAFFLPWSGRRSARPREASAPSAPVQA